MRAKQMVSGSLGRRGDMTPEQKTAIEALKDFAEKERLCLHIKFDEEGHGWSARLTSRFCHQPLCTGWSKTDLGEALADLQEKAERSLAPYRKRIAAAREEENRTGRQQLRRMGVR
jgi:hypothetical protein